MAISSVLEVLANIRQKTGIRGWNKAIIICEGYVYIPREPRNIN